MKPVAVIAGVAVAAALAGLGWWAFCARALRDGDAGSR